MARKLVVIFGTVSEPQRVKDEIEDVIGLEAQDAPLISAKNGIGIDEVLEQVVSRIPAPAGDAGAPLKALIFDSLYDSYKGVIIFCRVFDGVIGKVLFHQHYHIQSKLSQNY